MSISTLTLPIPLFEGYQLTLRDNKLLVSKIHISVAIKYDAMAHAAPIVVAKGSGDIAMKIREIAKEHEIPIVEDKPLARVLNKTVEIGQQIADNLFKAVAEILAYVYQLKSGQKKR